MRAGWAFCVLLLWTISATAGPVALEPTTSGGESVSLPKGWTVKTDATQGMFMAQQDPSKPDAPVLLVMVKGAGVNATEDQLIDTLVAKTASGAKVISRKSLQPTGREAIVEATVGGVKARLAVVAIAAGGAAIIGLLAAKPAELDALGGIGLVTSVIVTVKSTTAPAATTSPAMVGPETPASYKVDLEKGRLPQLTKAVALADLAGEWKDAGSSISGVYNAQTGAYVGFDAVLSSATYHIAATGAYTKDATHVELGARTASVTSRDTGTIAVAGPKVIEISIDNKKGPTWHGWYVIRGWYANGGHTVMKLNGPWQPRSDGTLEPAAFEIDGYGHNTYYWVRDK